MSSNPTNYSLTPSGKPKLDFSVIGKFKKILSQDELESIKHREKLRQNAENREKALERRRQKAREQADKAAKEAVREKRRAAAQKATTRRKDQAVKATKSVSGTAGRHPASSPKKPGASGSAKSPANRKKNSASVGKAYMGHKASVLSQATTAAAVDAAKNSIASYFGDGDEGEEYDSSMSPSSSWAQSSRSKYQSHLLPTKKRAAPGQSAEEILSDEDVPIREIKNAAPANKRRRKYSVLNKDPEAVQTDDEAGIPLIEKWRLLHRSAKQASAMVGHSNKSRNSPRRGLRSLQQPTLAGTTATSNGCTASAQLDLSSIPPNTLTFLDILPRNNFHDSRVNSYSPPQSPGSFGSASLAYTTTNVSSSSSRSAEEISSNIPPIEYNYFDFIYNSPPRGLNLTHFAPVETFTRSITVDGARNGASSAVLAHSCLPSKLKSRTPRHRFQFDDYMPHQNINYNDPRPFIVKKPPVLPAGNKVETQWQFVFLRRNVPHVRQDDDWRSWRRIWLPEARRAAKKGKRS